jgi:hypothetical protein
MSNNLLAQITRSIVDGEPDVTTELARQALDAGLEPLAIINQGLTPGMNIVGDKFATGEYFLPHLIIAASGMQQAMELLEPELGARQQTTKRAGTVVIGTVKGDIHEIGKSLVGTMLSARGHRGAGRGGHPRAGQSDDRRRAGQPGVERHHRRRWLCRGRGGSGRTGQAAGEARPLEPIVMKFQSLGKQA